MYYKYLSKGYCHIVYHETTKTNSVSFVDNHSQPYHECYRDHKHYTVYGKSKMASLLFSLWLILRSQCAYYSLNATYFQKPGEKKMQLT